MPTSTWPPSAPGWKSTGAASLAGYPPPGGHVGLREMIAERLAANRGYEVSPGDVFISDGAGGAIAIVLESFINPGDAVLVEEFTYMGSLRMMMERGAEPIHVACDDDGILPDALEDTLASLESSGRRAKFVWTIPVYQNPLGFTVSEGRRRAILEVAQKYGVPVMENESYADFRIDGKPLPPAMSGISDQGDVLYVSSFTKLLGCGLRVGFGVLPPGVQDALPQVNAENLPRRSVSHLATTLVYEYMRAHEADHIEAVRQALLARRDAMIDALESNFPSFCEWTHPHGGMMMFVKLPDNADNLVHPGQGHRARCQIQSGWHVPVGSRPQQPPAPHLQPQLTRGNTRRRGAAGRTLPGGGLFRGLNRAAPGRPAVTVRG